MPLMPNPYVTNVTIRNNRVVLTVEATEFTPDETLEISGHATQTGGAFAVFNDIQSVPEPNPDGRAYMWVTARPSAGFKKDHAVTVVLRAARVWTTVLQPQPDPGSSTPPGDVHLPADGDSADEGTGWSVVTKVAYAVPSSTGDADPAYTGGETSFQSGS
jgi:hypothetical protein